MYLYDTHVHTSECSKCAKSPAVDMVHAYKEGGYTGFVITNHFFRGNTAIDRELPWEEFVKPYYETYLMAKEEGDKIDFDVLFGIEEGIGKGKELLVYNIDLDFLLANPDLCKLEPDQFKKRVHDAGGFISHAHPYRYRDYMSGFYEPCFDGCDAVEVFNYGNHWSKHYDENSRALDAAIKLCLPYTCGSDSHGTDAGTRPNKTGMLFARRVKTGEQLIKEICSPDTKYLKSGEIYW